MYDIMKLIDSIDNDWCPILKELVEPYAQNISLFLEKEKCDFDGVAEIFPPQDHIFQAFKLCPFENLSVVLIAQDPYLKKNEAHGLCFSVTQGCKMPPSLSNVFKELAAEYGKKRANTDLTDWAQQNVLLLNRALTVREGKSMSHMKAWKHFTWDVLQYIAKNKSNIVYILWGNNAQDVSELIDKSKNLVLTSVHPSPLAQTRGVRFVGNDHFKLCNDYLKSLGRREIVWL
jgi:uracil-DNA glycosylase